MSRIANRLAAVVTATVLGTATATYTATASTDLTPKCGATAILPSGCDTSAAIIVKANVCIDTLTSDGHTDPAKECPCLKKVLDDPLISADIKILAEETLVYCVCESI